MSDCQTARASVLLHDLATLGRDPAIAAHMRTCSRCASDVLAVQAATRATAELLAHQVPAGDPATLARTILEEAVAWREQRTRWWRHASLSLATAGVAAWIIASSPRAAPLRAAIGFPDPPYVTTVLLQCVTPGDAASAAQPYLHSRGGSAVPGTGDVASITLSGARHDVAQAEIAIAKIDGRLGPVPGACAR